MELSTTLKIAINHYVEGMASPEEEALINDWFYSFNDTVVEIHSPLHDMRKRVGNAMHQFLIGEIRKDKKAGRVVSLKRWSMVAAMISIVIVGLFAVLYKQHSVGDVALVTEPSKGDVSPGYQRATLTLADGSVIGLDTIQTGLIAQHGNDRIIVKEKGQIGYVTGDDPNVAGLNRLEVPKGGMYSMQLPDGTTVWLNANSTLEFPSRFSFDERRVTLNGEGFFEVAAISNRPFIVQTNTLNIAVLGTSFNVSAYPNEEEAHTTLIEGSVRVSPKGASGNKESIVLQPGQDAAITTEQKTLIVSTINTSDATAWKQGMFSFRQADIRTVMRQLERWYDLSVEYDKNITTAKLTGRFDRNIPLPKLLESLERMGRVHFVVKGNHITVKP